MMKIISDEELIEKVKKGEILAFEILVLRYQDKLCAFVYRITKDWGLAEEAVQDTFINIYKTIERIDSSKKFSSYIFQIAKNTAISYLRKIKKDISLNDKVTCSEDETIYEKLARKEEINKLHKKLENLPGRYLRMIMLYYFHDLSYKEMQEKLKLPLNTIRTQLRRAKVELKKLLTYAKT